MSQKTKNERLTEETPETSIVNIHNDLERKEWGDTGEIKIISKSEFKKLYPHAKYLIGQQFTRLKVIDFVGRKKNGCYQWICQCNCELKSIVIVDVGQLNCKGKQSCGCFQIENRIKHGQHGTRTYGSWYNMKKRCLDKNSTSYHNYGGRGITVCKEWLDFKKFYEDMGECPEGLSLHRVDNNKSYYKENCVWATENVQNRHKRSNRYISYNGKTKIVTDWANEYNLPSNVLANRIFYLNWDMKKALETKVRPCKKVKRSSK